MQTVRFEHNGGVVYLCEQAGDQSGEYVRKDVAERLLAAAEAGNNACRAIEGAAMLSDNEERFGEMVSKKMGLVQAAVNKLTAALAFAAESTAPIPEDTNPNPAL